MKNAAFSFNTVYTHTNLDADNLENPDARMKEGGFFLILSQIFLTVTGIPSEVPLVASVQVHKVTRMRPLTPSAHQEELAPTLYKKDKAFSCNSEVTRTTAYHRKTAEEIKGIPRDFVR